ncbi:MAG: electron transport complex subunit RsxD [Wenzhouxiangellaceae bacterium]
MNHELHGAPHLPSPNSVAATMRQVLYALIPGVLAHLWFFGPGLALQILLAAFFALGLEAAMLKARGRPLQPFISDGSALVTAVLFALSIPPLSPWWISLTGMLFAIVLAKHAYGGLGWNLFNPAMVGVAAVLVAFPEAMSEWLLPRGLSPHVPGLGESLIAILTGRLPGPEFDAISQATPLDALKIGVAENRLITEIRNDPIFGDFGGRGWEWIANFYALGGLWLMYRRVISWHVPVAVLATVVIVSTPLWLFGPDTNPSPLQHIFSGALVLAAFFIATDPVSGCATLRGRLIFGAGVAILTLAIRRLGAYPDGVAFAVLMMNAAAPLIDRLTRPRAYGHTHGR